MVEYAAQRWHARSVVKLPSISLCGIDVNAKTQENAQFCKCYGLCRIVFFHLHRGAFTKQQLADKTGLVIGTVIAWINMLKRRKLVYIKFYKQAESHVGQHAAYWAWGYLEPDAEKNRNPLR